MEFALPQKNLKRVVYFMAQKKQTPYALQFAMRLKRTNPTKTAPASPTRVSFPAMRGVRYLNWFGAPRPILWKLLMVLTDDRPAE